MRQVGSDSLGEKRRPSSTTVRAATRAYYKMHDEFLFPILLLVRTLCIISFFFFCHAFVVPSCNTSTGFSLQGRLPQ